ncbi:MAG: hypothetical protein ABI175_17490, partial [Polyangiales bacterium]
MWLRCRALLLFSLVTLACGGKVGETEPTEGGGDDASIARPDTAPTGGRDTTPIVEGGVTCCPMGSRSCDAPSIGGSPPCGRRGPYDVREWEVKVDPNGCPYLSPSPGGGSCSTPPDRTTGLPCTDDTTCDITGAGVNACSNAAFAPGTLYPAPVCIGRGCDPGTHATPRDCDGATGLCLDDGAAGLCLPRCTFDT